MNTNSNLIEIKRHTVIYERAVHLAKALDGEQKKAVDDIAKKSKQILDTIGDRDNVVYNPNKRELAQFHTSALRYVRTDILDPIYEIYGHNARQLGFLFEDTEFSDELKGNWILLMKKMREDKESKHIDNILKEFIRSEIVNEFVKQNTQILKKYNYGKASK